MRHYLSTDILFSYSIDKFSSSKCIFKTLNNPKPMPITRAEDRKTNCWKACDIHLDSVWDVLPQAPPVALTPQTRIQWIPHRGRFHLSSWWCRCVKASLWRDQITSTTTSCLKACSPWRLITRMTTYSRRHSESPISFTWIPIHGLWIIFSLMMVESLRLFPCSNVLLLRAAQKALQQEISAS